MNILQGVENLRLFEDRLKRRLNDTLLDRELIEFMYDRQRYLKTLEPVELLTRYHQLLNNLAFLLDALRDEPPAYAGFISSWWWMTRYVDMLREFALRGMEVPPHSPELMRVGEPNPLLQRTWSGPYAFIIRYGQREHVEDFFYRGQVRIAPASTYKDSALKAAQFDDERAKSRISPPNRVRIQRADGRLIVPIGDVTTTRSTHDYHTLCMSTEHDPRLFRSFGADRALIIWNVPAFASRLETAARDHLPDWHFFNMSTEYFDPRRLENGQRLTTHYSKDFAYAYQREYRFVWFKVPPISKLTPFFVNVGDVSSFTTLIDPSGAVLDGRPLP